MKANAVFLVSAIAAGAGAGFLLSLALPGKGESTSETAKLFRNSAMSVRNVLESVQETPVVLAFRSTVTTIAQAVGSSPRPGSAVMLLSEPVVILTGTTNGWQRLEAGKQVTLIANEGRFIRVKYDEKEVSIPRTAVTQGIAVIR